MAVLLHSFALLSLAVAGIGIAYLLFCAVCVLRFRGASASPAGKLPPVTILVPLCGAEPGLKRRLECLCEQDYGSPLQIICGVADPADKAVEAVGVLARERPEADIRICTDPRHYGRNAKVSNLINMIQRADYDAFFFIDSDIEAPPDLVGRLVGVLQQPKIGAVTCLYYGAPAAGIWARLSATGITSHFLPDAVAGISLKLARPCFGAVIALRQEMLWHIGGLHPLADCLWDDYALGEAVRRTGHEVAIAPFALPHVCTERSARELLSREIRSARTIRRIAPLGYAGNFLTHPLGFALIALAAGWSGLAVAACLLAIGARACLCECIRRRFNAATVPAGLQPLRDVIAFIVHLVAAFGNRVVWRGKEYRVASHGALTPVRSRDGGLFQTGKALFPFVTTHGRPSETARHR